MPTKHTLDLDLLLQPDGLAQQIGQKYNVWKQGRTQKEAASAEVRKYVFATDTTTTTNAKLPWKNKTTRPKLCQIRDNLYANYIKALFPNDDWFTWEAADEQGASEDKKRAIISYMNHIFRSSDFQKIIANCLADWVDYGNCFADVTMVDERKKVPGEADVSIYTGPKALRISPLDIVFDITAPSFKDGPSIVRSMLSFGQIHKLKSTNPDWNYVSEEIISKIKNNRTALSQAGTSARYDKDKAAQLTADGFNSLSQYYQSGMVEILDFEGDLFDVQSGKLYENHRITVIDRCYVVRNEPITNWFGVSHKQHVGWRLRPDNVWAMGPLDNLVGLQYRLDHLENMRADIFDMIAYPVRKIKGYVEDSDYGPGEDMHMEVDADVEFMHPDATALNADLQIEQIENAMEELAGAPRQAMGIRTPGEKTAFEVQNLDNAASRLFQSKLDFFEKFFLEPLINSMLEVGRRNLDTPTLVAVTRDDLGVQEFLTLSQKDITAKGRLVPMGARHFAAQAQLVQNIVQLSNTMVYQDEAVKAHLSSKKLAKVLMDALGLAKYDIYGENIRVLEAMETQQLSMQAQEELMVNATTPTEGTEESEVVPAGVTA